MRENEGKIFQDSLAGGTKKRKFDKGASCSSKAEGDGQTSIVKAEKKERSDGHPPSKKKSDGHPPSKKKAKKEKDTKKKKTTSDRCRAAMREQEQVELREATRRSCVGSGMIMSRRSYRDVEVASEESEEEFLDLAVTKANEIEQSTRPSSSSSEVESEHEAFGTSIVKAEKKERSDGHPPSKKKSDGHPPSKKKAKKEKDKKKKKTTLDRSESEHEAFGFSEETQAAIAATAAVANADLDDNLGDQAFIDLPFRAAEPPSDELESVNDEPVDEERSDEEHELESVNDEPVDEERSDEEQSDGEQSDAEPDGDDDGIPTPPTAPTRGRKKKRKTVTEPDSDNDPDPPNPRQKIYVPDRHGWNRSLERVKVEPFAGPSPSGPTFPPLAAPVSYFLKFFPLILIIQIATWTTTILLKAGKQATTAVEIQAWIGCRLVMGLVKIPNYQDYWSTESAYFNGQIAGTMTRQRYDDVNAFLACNDPALDPEKYPKEDPTMFTDRKHKYCWMRNHPLYPLQPVWDTVLECCQKNYNMARHISIDEAMVKYSGFKAQVRKFFMPLKPIRAGFKLYAMAEATTGYLFNFITHPWKSGIPAKMIDITLEVAKPILGRYHHIFTDKLYTSMALGRLLLSHNTYLTGAVKSNSKGLPVDFLKDSKKNPRHHLKLKRLSKTKRGTFYTRQNNAFTSVVWKDSAIMQLLSSAHQGYRTKPTANTPGDVVTRQVKADGERVRTPTSVNAPRQAVDYVKYMGGVDRADQLRSYYSCSRKSQQWWKKLLFFTIDTAVSNAWLCYKWHNPTKASAEEDDDDREEEQSARLSHSQFVLAIAKGLIYGTSQQQQRRRDPQQSKYQPLPAHHGAGTDHQSANLQNKHARQCQWCKQHGTTNASGNVPTTRHGCKICNVNLCRPPRRCFLAYHGGE